jgi:hypothetical protein
MRNYVTYRALLGYFVLFQLGEFLGKILVVELYR